MVIVKPNYHSSDGGADLPWYPTRLPQRCKSKPIMRNVKSKNHYLNLCELFEESGWSPFLLDSTRREARDAWSTIFKNISPI
ncbi:hypothetical protein PanWU01x14_174970 [Parasponia andersonii]|uniref:Uncharacterized protein n=1 Tax=Parasponia andersonii TaxID=3476 RepID=A0A2P5C8H6_PARAD|nr:hypothetical protein PanWU01x14_174970 [Parasponia andersonii]